MSGLLAALAGASAPLGGEVIPSTVGLSGWYKPNSLTGADGDPVTSWPASNGGPALAATGTARPTYRVAGYVEFNGSQRVFSTDTRLDLGAAWTVSMVLDTLPANANGMAWMFGNAASYKRRALWCEQQTGTTFSGYESNVATAVAPTPKCVITIRCRVDGTVDIFKDGVSIASQVPSPALAAYTWEGFAIGANVSLSEGWTGRAYELAAFGTALSDSDRAAVDSDLMARHTP